MTLQGKHKKHAEIKRPNIGQVGRRELAILGAPCGLIQKIAIRIITNFPHLKIAYLDADHQEEERTINSAVLTDKISHYRMDFERSLNPFDRKIWLRDYDMVLVNGNHFTANQQIVVINEKKKESLSRKLDRLTDIQHIILDEGMTQPHEYLVNHVANLNDIPSHLISDLSEMYNSIQKQVNPSQIKGLVLGGGKSSRMGRDKRLLNYHGVAQIEYMASELKKVVDEVFLGTSRIEDLPLSQDYPQIVDSFVGLGPFGSILSAFREDPDSAWLVVACDQPLLSAKHLLNLVNGRDPSKLATCYFNPETNFPEPLITLWELKAYARMLQFLALGYSCPRKVLINSDVHIIHGEEVNFLKNANTVEEYDQLSQLITTQA